MLTRKLEKPYCSLGVTIVLLLCSSQSSRDNRSAFAQAPTRCDMAIRFASTAKSNDEQRSAKALRALHEAGWDVDTWPMNADVETLEASRESDRYLVD